MSDEDRIDRERECGDEVAAYALGALEEGELERFRRHLETCVVCRDELSSFQQIVDALPMSAPTFAAPASLRRRVLRAIDSEPRLDRPAASQRSKAARAWRPGFRLPRPALAFGGALTLAVAVVAVVLAVGSSPTSTPRARSISAQVTGGGSASLNLSKGHAELVVHRFAHPPAGQIYEVWLQRGQGSLQPTRALFTVNSQGDASLDVPGDLKGVSHVLVTREPAGGTSRPTHKPVITADLT
jgi:anti-sigma-K factor RskA